MRAARGSALLIVLWAMALLTILLGSFVVVARTENLQSRHLFDSTRARYAAEAGLSRAVYELRRTDPLTRWVPDGRPYELEFDGMKLVVNVVDETGKIDINGADEVILTGLFRAAGADDVRAQSLAHAVQDWRDADDLVRTYGAEDRDYEGADLGYGAADLPFSTTGELQQVLGMDYELYRVLEPHITVFARSPRPNPAFASAFVLQTLEGMTPELAAQLVAARQLVNPADPGAAALMMPDGTPLVAGGGGGTYTVKVRATLPNGAWTLLDASIRLGGPPGARAYSIVRWREGSAE